MSKKTWASMVSVRNISQEGGGVLERDSLRAQLTDKPPIWYPTPDKLWLASSPDGGLEFYATEQEALDAGAGFIEDHIGDDGWDEAVDQVFVAEVKYITKKTNVVKRPADDQIDEDGFDEDGNDWSGDHDCKCDYKLETVPKKNDVCQFQTHQRGSVPSDRFDFTIQEKL